MLKVGVNDDVSFKILQMKDISTSFQYHHLNFFPGFPLYESLKHVCVWGAGFVLASAG